MDTIFLTVARSSDLPACQLMIDSLRCFGGELSQAPFLVFSADPERVRSLESADTRILPLHTPSPMENLPFGWKVAACATAESQVPAGTRSLVWIDTACLIVQPPVLVALHEGHAAAFRPVHIRNVGLPPTEPLDEFWKGIYSAAGVGDLTATVTSFVDGQRLRAYFNSHSFAINPGLGLMQRWQKIFLQLVKDPEFQARACSEEAHQVFLFQAVLSTLIATSIEPDRLQILPASYNYPYHLHDQVPVEKKLAAMNDAVSVTYEDFTLHPGKITGIRIDEPLRSWLGERLPPG